MKIADLARELNVAVMTVHRHIDRKKAILRGHLRKEGKTTFVSPDGIEILRTSIAESNVRPSKPAAPTVPATISEDRMVGIEKSVLLLVERLNRLEADNARQAKEIYDLRSRLEPPSLMAIEEPSSIVAPIKPWSPARLQPTLTWYEKAWFSIFDPTALRSIET